MLKWHYAASLPKICPFRTRNFSTSAGGTDSGNNSKFSAAFRFFNEYAAGFAVMGGTGIIIFAGGASDLWSKLEIRMAKTTFESEMRNLKTTFESEQALLRGKLVAEREKLVAEQTVMREKLVAEQNVMREKHVAEREKLVAELTVMREKLVAAELVYDEAKKTIQRTMEARIAEAELRAAKQFLLYGYSDQYAAYQEKLDEQAKKSSPGETESDPREKE